MKYLELYNFLAKYLTEHELEVTIPLFADRIATGIVSSDNQTNIGTFNTLYAEENYQNFERLVSSRTQALALDIVLAIEMQTYYLIQEALIEHAYKSFSNNLDFFIDKLSTQVPPQEGNRCQEAKNHAGIIIKNLLRALTVSQNHTALLSEAMTTIDIMLSNMNPQQDSAYQERKDKLCNWLENKLQVTAIPYFNKLMQYVFVVLSMTQAAIFFKHAAICLFFNTTMSPQFLSIKGYPFSAEEYSLLKRINQQVPNFTHAPADVIPAATACGIVMPGIPLKNYTPFLRIRCNETSALATSAESASTDRPKTSLSRADLIQLFFRCMTKFVTDMQQQLELAAESPMQIFIRIFHESGNNPLLLLVLIEKTSELIKKPYDDTALNFLVWDCIHLFFSIHSIERRNLSLYHLLDVTEALVLQYIGSISNEEKNTLIKIGAFSLLPKHWLSKNITAETVKALETYVKAFTDKLSALQSADADIHKDAIELELNFIFKNTMLLLQALQGVVKKSNNIDINLTWLNQPSAAQKLLEPLFSSAILSLLDLLIQNLKLIVTTLLKKQQQHTIGIQAEASTTNKNIQTAPKTRLFTTQTAHTPTAAIAIQAQPQQHDFGGSTLTAIASSAPKTAKVTFINNSSQVEPMLTAVEAVQATTLLQETDSQTPSLPTTTSQTTQTFAEERTWRLQDRIQELEKFILELRAEHEAAMKNREMQYAGISYQHQQLLAMQQNLITEITNLRQASSRISEENIILRQANATLAQESTELKQSLVATQEENATRRQTYGIQFAEAYTRGSSSNRSRHQHRSGPLASAAASIQDRQTTTTSSQPKSLRRHR